MADKDDTIGGEELFALLGLSFRASVDRLHSTLAESGYDDIRPAHGYAFSRLSPDGATASQLAEHLGITKQAAGQMVDHLEARGYVTRAFQAHDRRVKLVLLTQRGRDCIELGTQTMDEIALEWSERAGPASIATTRDALRAVLAGEDLTGHRGLRPAW